MRVLRIINWDEHYENNRSRELKTLDWVPIPNRVDGDGYTALVEVRDDEDAMSGAVRYGAWLALVLLASKSRVRGVLLRSINSNPGTIPQPGATTCQAHDETSMARISRLPRAAFENCIERAIEVGWVEWLEVDTAQLTRLSHGGAGIPQAGAGKRLRNRTELNSPPTPAGGKRGERKNVLDGLRNEFAKAKP